MTALSCYRLTGNAEGLTAVLHAVILGGTSPVLPAIGQPVAGLLTDEFARDFLLNPVCLRKVAANCRSTSDTYYTVS